MPKAQRQPDPSAAIDLPRTFKLKDGRPCTFRLMLEADAEALCAFLPQTHTESDFLNWLPGEFQMTVEQERKFIRETLGNHPAIGVMAEVDGVLVASGGAWSHPRRRFKHQAECGLSVLKAFWGQGIGRAFMSMFIEWGQAVGLRKLTLRAVADNERAIQLYESVGFVEEARLREDVTRADGTYGDTIVMAHWYERE